MPKMPFEGKHLAHGQVMLWRLYLLSLERG